jgi:hypothetical protein
VRMSRGMVADSKEVGKEGGARRRRREMVNGSDERMSVV